MIKQQICPERKEPAVLSLALESQKHPGWEVWELFPSIFPSTLLSELCGRKDSSIRDHNHRPLLPTTPSARDRMGSIQEAQALPAEQRSPAYSRLAAEYVGGKDVSKLLGLVEHRELGVLPREDHPPILFFRLTSLSFLSLSLLSSSPLQSSSWRVNPSIRELSSSQIFSGRFWN